jgi:hypothetical protein
VDKLVSIKQLLEKKLKIETENYPEIEHVQPMKRFEEIDGHLASIWK